MEKVEFVERDGWKCLIEPGDPDEDPTLRIWCGPCYILLTPEMAQRLCEILQAFIQEANS